MNLAGGRDARWGVASCKSSDDGLRISHDDSLHRSPFPAVPCVLFFAKKAEKRGSREKGVSGRGERLTISLCSVSCSFLPTSLFCHSSVELGASVEEVEALLVMPGMTRGMVASMDGRAVLAVGSLLVRMCVKSRQRECSCGCESWCGGVSRYSQVGAYAVI